VNEPNTLYLDDEASEPTRWEGTHSVSAEPFSDPLAALEDMQKTMGEYLPVGFRDHADPLCMRNCGFQCRGVCNAIDPNRTERRKAWGHAPCDSTEALAELRIQLGGRVPVYVLEPHLRLGHMCWTTQSLPRVFLANDVYLRMQEATRHENT
jgi:hypothetical protein